MKYRHETLSDIASDIRSLANSPYDVSPSVYHPTFSPTVYGKPIQDYLRELADRIVAAGKRSEDTWMAILKSGNKVECSCDVGETLSGNSIAADVIAELCGDPSIAQEVRDKIANETVDDVLAEMDGSAVGRHWAARIKAAHGRELDELRRQVGDRAKLREALTKVKEWMAHRIATCGFEFSATFPTMLEGVVLPALAAPARNCDVGTAVEQAKRMNMFCDSHGHGFDGQKCYACENCKLISIDRCELTWAQMPYEAEKGGAK